MWINGKWHEQPELSAYIKKLQDDRDEYKKELIDVLRDIVICVKGEDFLCEDCDFYGKDGCRSKISQYSAKLRLEELLKGGD